MSGDARAYLAARDQHIAERDLHLHYADGGRTARRAESKDTASLCPYPGLRAFTAAEHQWFHGREAATALLLEQLAGRLETGGPLMVVAPSGAGKSSLLTAGLLPGIARGALPAGGSAHWPVAVLTPTDRPLRALSDALAPVLGGDVAEARTLVTSPAIAAAPLRDALRRYVQQRYVQQRDAPHGTQPVEPVEPIRIVLVVDQLEELFTLCTDPAERRAFVEVLDRLAAPSADGPAPALVVYGLRADFVPACADHPQLRDAWPRGPLLLGPLSDEELRAVILFPAYDTGLEVEPGLVEILLGELGEEGPAGPEGHRKPREAGLLPLLAHALRITWQQRHGHVLTVAGYRATGGIRRAVATTAEHVFAGLDESAARAAPWVFLQLVKVGEGTRDTRTPRDHASLLAAAGNETALRQSAVAEVLESFTRARLVTRDGPTVTLTHEVLIRAWPRLWEWVDQDRSGNLVRQRLEESAAGWEAGQDTSLLYRGTRLEAARTAVASAPPPGATTRATAFLAASVRRSNRAARIRRAVGATLVALAVVASCAAVLALQQSATAERQRDRAVFHQISATADQVRSLNGAFATQLDLAAYRMDPTEALRSRLITDQNLPVSASTAQNGGPVSGLDLSPDGRLMASTGGSAGLRLWQLSGAAPPRPLGRPLQGAYVDVAFHPDGRTLAAGRRDGNVVLLDLAQPALPRQWGPPLGGHRGLAGMKFSPDGTRLVTMASGADRTMRMWDVTDRAAPRPVGSPVDGRGTVNTLDFSPDGQLLATTGMSADGSADETVRLWNVAGPAGLTPVGRPLTGHTGAVNTVLFSPDGRTLASAGFDATVRLWDVKDPARVKQKGQPLYGQSALGSLAFSPDGRTLAVSGTEAAIYLWTIADQYRERRTARSAPLTGHVGGVFSLAFAPDGRTLVSGGTDGSLRLWALPATVLNGHGDPTLSADGKVLAAVGFDGVLQLYDTTDPAAPRAVGPPLARRINVALFGPAGRTLAATDADGTLHLWDVQDPAHPTRHGEPLTGDFVRIAFSPDGRTLLNIEDPYTDPVTTLWDLTDPADPVQRGDALAGPEGTTGIHLGAYSPNGRYFAGATLGVNNRTSGLFLLLWDLTDPDHPIPLPSLPIGEGGGASVLTFSPDGRTLATGSQDGVIRLWDSTDPTRGLSKRAELRGHRSLVSALAFSPDGRTLVSGGADTTVRLWDPDRRTAVGQPLTGHTAPLLGVAFAPDGHTLVTGGWDNTVRLWETDPGRLKTRLCTTTTSTADTSHWNRYVPGVPYRPPCP
ncbi:hypothetical protein ACFYVL_40640 [Streptomyces sp. NPDC004111]|uniref:nSTAND1 domain-containing NTPase n=1 Tax=Streptomyces sp. NPDC004111 TaxID=3364690 RepID=UPI00368AC81E